MMAADVFFAWSFNGQFRVEGLRLAWSARRARRARVSRHVRRKRLHAYKGLKDPCDSPSLVSLLRLVPSTGVYLGLGFHDFRASCTKRTNILAY